VTVLAASTDAPILSRVPTELLIGGQWRPAAGKARFDVEDPATGSPLASVANATAADAVAALDAAHAAQASWALVPAHDRSEILRRAFEIIRDRADEFAELITAEMGKPLAESRAEVGYGNEFFRWFCGEAPRVAGSYAIAPDAVNRLLTIKRPVGPCLLITPWNFPLAMATRKIAPAIAAGCTMVFKPSDLTPLTALLLAEVLREAGLPDGVLNVLTTTDPGRVCGPIIADARLRKLTFTGSTSTGQQLIRASADQVLRTSMELGGNAPFLVFDDADLTAAVDGAMVAKLRNGGQACVAANRFLVHESIAAQFTELLAARIGSSVVGRGADPDTTIGPLINRSAVDKVGRLVTDAVSRGARVVTGGAAVDGPGYFYQPTVVADVPADATLLDEEIFGPVAAVLTFADEDEAIRLANDTQYGLVCFAYTRDLNRAMRLPERLEAGMLGLNTGVVSNPAAPFGGVKHSGLGREGGQQGIEEYLETCYVAVGDITAEGAR
jgi:succinate-semialdehyde dehydrogenase / glutarate-semialdehyde dehydrogenase